MAFKMSGWSGYQKPPVQPGQVAPGSMMTKKSIYKKEEGPAYGGGGETWSEYDKKADGDLNAITKSQKAYEARMKKSNPNWKREDDDIWKKRQNQINKMVDSNKRHEVREKKIRLTTKTIDRIGGGTKEIDLMKNRMTGDKYKNIVKKNEAGQVESEKTVDKTRGRGVEEPGPLGTEKLKKKYDVESGTLTGVRGYSTREKRQAAKAEKKRLKAEAKANRRSLRDAKKLEKKKKREEKREERKNR